MQRIIELEIKNIFSSADKKRSVEKYAEILKNFWNTNTQTDKTFQKKFNGFYRVRRNKEWQKVYYTILETGKTQDLYFELVLRELYEKTGRIEASFTSKLIHTLNNNMPIWDQFVLKNLEKKVPVCKGEKKIENVIRIYEEICSWYQDILQAAEIKRKIVEFDEIFPEYAWFSQMKKIDFLLWQMR